MGDWKDNFPDLSSAAFQETSPSTPRYNCIAWAAGSDRRWWWPIGHPHTFWPPGIRREETIECFIEAFAKDGYLPCEADQLEEGYEKVAIYVDASRVPKHMARQLPNGKWTSKLGPNVDIEHSTLSQLEGPEYGNAYQILKRPIPSH
jgi:hypothetical protein